MSQKPLQLRRPLFGCVALQRQRRLTDAGDGLRPSPLEQLCRLFEPPLAEPQLPQAGQRLAHERRPDLLELLRRRSELRFRFRPLAVPDQHTGVLDAADRREHPNAPAPGELLHARTPLGGAVVVAHPLAGEDLPAADHADRVQLLHLAAGGRGGRLVEAAQPRGDFARTD
ncbi:MAG TPA: hypothetical protein VIV10_10445, partial [Gemmatimonadales bacterium]